MSFLAAMTSGWDVSVDASFHVMSWKASLLLMGVLGILGLTVAGVVFLVAWNLGRRKGQ